MDTAWPGTNVAVKLLLLNDTFTLVRAESSDPADRVSDSDRVILDASTFSVVEVRGVIATLAEDTRVGAYFTVVAPEVVDGEGVTVSPAVLMGFEGNDGSTHGSTAHQHKLSRDGGHTWHTVFTGVFWSLVYMGNGLHPVSLI